MLVGERQLLVFGGVHRIPYGMAISTRVTYAKYVISRGQPCTLDQQLTLLVDQLAIQVDFTFLAHILDDIPMYGRLVCNSGFYWNNRESNNPLPTSPSRIS